MNNYNIPVSYLPYSFVQNNPYFEYFQNPNYLFTKGDQNSSKLVNITMAKTNMNQQFLISNPKNFNLDRKSGIPIRKSRIRMSKSISSFENELQMEKMKNEILIKKILDLEKIIKEKKIDCVEQNQVKTPKKKESNNKKFLKNLIVKMEKNLIENEMIYKTCKKHAENFEEKLIKYEERLKNDQEQILGLLTENEKLRHLVDKMKSSFDKEIKKLSEENIKLVKENEKISDSSKITTEKYIIEKNKNTVLVEQISHLTKKNQFLIEEINGFKVKSRFY